MIWGRTGSGKTVLARALHRSIAPPRLVIDPKDDADGTGGGYAVAFRDPGRLPDVPVARFVPRDPMDLDAYDAVYGAVWQASGSGRRWHVWLDEARFAAPSRTAPRNLVRHLTQGRSRGLGHVASAQRPVEVSPQLAAQADHLVVFPLGYPPDVDLAAAAVQMPPAELRAILGRLPRYGWCWYDVRAGRLGVADRVVVGGQGVRDGATEDRVAVDAEDGGGRGRDHLRGGVAGPADAGAVASPAAGGGVT